MLVSGVLSSFVDRLTAKAADTEKYLDATVTSSDLAVSRFRQSGDAGMIARCRQMILNYAALNARVCAGQTMRLYTKSKGGGKSIKSRRRNDYLRTPARGYGPGSKAARWAEQAEQLSLSGEPEDDGDTQFDEDDLEDAQEAPEAPKRRAKTKKKKGGR